MPRLRRGVALALGQIAVASSTFASVANVKMDGWYNCSQYSLAEQIPTGETAPYTAQCAIFKAPLCHTGVCEDSADRQIDIFVKRYVVGKNSKGKPNVIFMQGGPGSASPTMETAMTVLHELMGDQVNVYTMDHRGTGRSTKFECVAAQTTTSGSPGGITVERSEFAGCAQELETQYGSDLASFSVTSAASDLHYFITNVLAEETTFVYGVSYGTLLVERLIHLMPPGVAGYILDGVATTSGAAVDQGMFISKWDVGMDEVGRYFLSFCEQNHQTCGQYFDGSSVTSKLQSLLDELQSGVSPCTIFLAEQFAQMFKFGINTISTSATLRQVLGELLKSYTLRNAIPLLTYRLSRCTGDDQQVVARFLQTLGEQLTELSENDRLKSQLLYGLIVYSEMWESPPVTDAVANQRFHDALIASGVSVGAYCAYTKDWTAAACAPYQHTLVGNYTASPISYKKDQYYNVAATPASNVSVLILSGKMDPQTPHKYAQYLFEALGTTNKQLVTFQFATHGALWRSFVANASAPTCGMTILVSYVASGGDLSALDTSCVADEAVLDFGIPAVMLSDWLNTTSPFDGEYIGSPRVVRDDQSEAAVASSFKVGFVLLVVLFGVILAVATVFLVLWRRARKLRAAAKDEVGYQELRAS